MTAVMTAAIWRILAVLVVLPVGVGGAMARPATPVSMTVLGDSLAAGYGLPPEEAFPARLESALQQAGFAVTVANAGVSGDTSAGGLARLAWVMADRPDIVIVELGANDGLRGLDPASTEKNLDAILRRLASQGVDVLLAGMLAPPNLGRDYETRFNRVFPTLAERHDVVFFPFFLADVAARPELNQADGIHPNRQGVARIVANILPLVREMIVARQTRNQPLNAP